jgi:phospholipid transport system substrate-binding protein
MKSTLAAIALFLAAACALPATADGDPAAPVHKLCDTLIEVMKQGKELGVLGRENKLRPVINSAYDMTALSKATLGLAANKLSPEELAKLSDAYAHFSAATYADQFSKWDGERFEVGAPHPGANGATVVPSVIVGGDGSRTSIDYVVHENNGVWSIIDVLFNGSISQVAVRRSEFLPIFRQSGLDALVSQIEAKAAGLEKK